MKSLFLGGILSATALLMLGFPGTATAQFEVTTPTAFTYQGFLEQDRVPAHGPMRMSFELLDAFAGTPLLPPITTGVEVVQGVFTAKLDFGPVFDDRPVALQLAAEVAPDVFVPLDPPQPICAAPRAVYALLSQSAQSAVSAQSATSADTVVAVPDGALSANVPLLVNDMLVLTNPAARTTSCLAGRIHAASASIPCVERGYSYRTSASAC